MGKESFLMVSLEEEKSKKLAQVLSNDTSRKILDLLSRTDMMTETEIAKELKIPLSTAHYNLSLLVKSDLINDNHFTYSEKGKKISHYQLSNKYVIIAPKKSEKIFEKLKDFLPAVVISALAGILIKYFWPIQRAGEDMVRNINVIEDSLVKTTADEVIGLTAEPVSNAFASSQDFAFWFLAGSLFALLISFVWTAWIKRNKE
jgi:DNA-binding transcriptional ArsR family regulator